MRQIKNIFRAGNNQPIPYFKLICNPHNFMDSVQNALIISFLVKENLVSIVDGTDGLPHVIVNTGSKEASTDVSNQAICRLDVELCEVRNKTQHISYLLTISYLILSRNMPSITISRNQCLNAQISMKTDKLFNPNIDIT